jgi:hypothetical protein
LLAGAAKITLINGLTAETQLFGGPRAAEFLGVA